MAGDTVATATCMLCGSPRLSTLHRGLRDRYGLDGGTYAFLACAGCGSATLDPQPPAAAIPSLYPPSYTFKATGRAPLPLRLLRAVEWHALHLPIYRHRLTAIRRLTGLLKGRVLEVGCGSGLFLQRLAAAGYDVEGLEISEDDIAYGRGSLGLAIHRGELADLDPAQHRYDAVLLFAVLEHLPDPTATIRQAFRVLSGGGWVVVEVPVIDSGQATRLGRRWHAVTEAPRHLFIPSCRAVHHVLEAAGFRDVRSTPGPLVDNAGIIALSLVPGATTSSAYGRPGTVDPLLRRIAAALLVPPALLLAACERRRPGGATGTMLFCGRKPPAAAGVP